VSLNLPIIPYKVSTGAEYDLTWNTVVNTNEGGISGRKAFQQWPARQFHLTVGPGEVSEFRKIFLACMGRVSPVGVRDWSDYQFTDQVLSLGGGGTSTAIYQLQETFTPATGSLSFVQPILLPDQTEVALTLKVNGSPYGGSFSVLDYGYVELLTPPASGDVVTASGEKLVPCCFMTDDMTIKVLKDGLLEIQDVQLREIFKEELIDLTGVADPLA